MAPKLNNIRKAIEHIKPLRHKHEAFAHTYVQAVKRAVEGSVSNIPISEFEDAINIFIENSENWHSKPLAENFIDQIFFAVRSVDYQNLENKLSPELIFKMVETHFINGGVINKLYAAQYAPINQFLREYFESCGLGEKYNTISEHLLKTQESAFTEDQSIKNEIQNGNLIVVKVRTTVPNRNFCFGTDNQGEDFFIHYSAIVQEFDGAVDTIFAGSVLALAPVVLANKEYRSAETAYIVPLDWLQ